MQLKDCQVGDRVRVWYDGSMVVADNKGTDPCATMEATIGELDPPYVALVWKLGEVAPIRSWCLANLFSWTSPMIAQGYERAYWVDDYCECELISYQMNQVVVSSIIPDVLPPSKAQEVVLPIDSQEKPFDFEAYNYGIKRT
jgi:hypothetical protein